MSGTSLDGLDIASCIFSRENGSWEYEIEAAETISYTRVWAEKLSTAHKLDGYALTKLDSEYGLYLGECVNRFCERLNKKPSLIASHGHTVFHEPDTNISLQVGSGAAVSATTGLPVVSDFRSLDVCLGGQGAPLVPIADKLLFSDYDCCLNLGGIANISYDEEGFRKAYDVAPCNLLLNRLATQVGKEYDENGEMARSGQLNQMLLDELCAWDYFKRQPPKSLDKEQLLTDLIPAIGRAEIPLSDKIRTVTELIALLIGSAASMNGKMLVTGGGAFNKFLVERIQHYTSAEVVVPDEKIVSFKEALAFAFLGLLRVLNEPNCLRSVTGAPADSVGGALYGDFSHLSL
jgi:anhydro-N-acetylmuramic acid kinase